ncbi:MAU2 chromatid cohesion factor-like protein [Chlorella sorokiniana]|uniref:MAU2 chromatid cohesion factor-like protein n=1 Tax=Chlorella sorokiniana TaxID=3076 RepID=A0A2P6U4X6_CHLSO|nr:MAU2 chromatid cohesion factor-like protein [Chlorella sorokiniana]|eukprot:PRW61370.1 MAU2 chromatid cohesion factor-like protein [Chlorella sorokiniana]
MLDRSALLLRLAREWEERGAYAAAIKCLMPVCDDAGELPTVTAAARLHLARLLLAHFDNVGHAKSALLAAEQDLRQMQGNHLLKCEVCDALVLANQRLGAVQAEADALQAGLKACRAGATSKDKEALVRWQAYFQFKLVEHALTHRGQEAAAEALEQLGAGGDAAAQHPTGKPASPSHRTGPQLSALEQALALFCRATLHLAAGEPGAASDVIGQVNPLIPLASAGSDVLKKQLTAHYSVLYIAMAAAAGRINELSQDPSGNIQLLMSLHQLLGEVAGQPWGYAWLPPPAIAALGSLLHASLLRSLGKGALAATHLLAAQEAVEQQLTALRINMEASEADLGMQAIWQGRIYCHLRVLVAEQQVLQALGASRFAQAAEQLAALTALLDRFPSLLHDCVPATQMLLGHYAHSLGHYAEACTYFKAVLASDAAPLHDTALLAAALAELQADAGPAGLRTATDLLEQRGLTELPHVLSLPVHDRTAALVCNALRAQRTGDDSNARIQLTKALKAAHAHLGNTQMVAQVLNLLAPMQAGKGDRSGAEQMLTSSTTLAKSAGDLPTLLTASRALLRIFSGGPGEEERASKQHAYVERKAGELAAAVAAAQSAPCHAALLTWRPAVKA